MNSLSHPSRVAVVSCNSYAPDDVLTCVAEGIRLLGGAEQFAAPGETLLLKPNLLVSLPPESMAVTHPAVFSAVAQVLAETHATLTYGDSPGFESREGAAARKSGIQEAAEALGLEPADMSTQRELNHPGGVLIKRFTLAKGVVDADGLISISKLKSHGLTRFTGAVKNQFGCIPGLLKAEFHARLPEISRFAQMLVDLNTLIRPRLYVMDGIIAMEGNGPRNGTPRNMGVLLFSTDPIALDSTACRLVNLDPALVPTNTAGEASGLGTMSNIELVGDPIEPLIQADFVINRGAQSGTSSLNNSSLRTFFRQFITPRPTVLADVCKRCGICEQVCPIDPPAVTVNGDIAHHDYMRCIRCYCCQELCPYKAIVIRTPLPGRVLHHIKR